MKIKNLLFLFLCFAFLSCSKNNSDAEKISYKWPQMVEQLTQRTFDNSKAMEELSRERTENKYLLLGDRKQDYDMNDYSTYGIGYKGKIPVTPRVMHTYNDIMIGDVSYNNLKGAYSTIRGSGFRKGSQAHMMKLNNFGNVVFYDHIIQFDLVNKQFIIK